MSVEGWVMLFQTVRGRTHCLVFLAPRVEEHCMGAPKSKGSLQVPGGVFSIFLLVAGVSTRLQLSSELSWK